MAPRKTAARPDLSKAKTSKPWGPLLEIGPMHRYRDANGVMGLFTELIETDGPEALVYVVARNLAHEDGSSQPHYHLLEMVQDGDGWFEPTQLCALWREEWKRSGVAEPGTQLKGKTKAGDERFIVRPDRHGADDGKDGFTLYRQDQLEPGEFQAAPDPFLD